MEDQAAAPGDQPPVGANSRDKFHEDAEYEQEQSSEQKDCQGVPHTTVTTASPPARGAAPHP
jgi:hypothetical protein